MKFRIGDKVKFLSNPGGGRITKIVDKTIANVMTEDDFEIPVLMSDIIRIDEDELISGKNQDLDPFEIFKKEPEGHHQDINKGSEIEIDDDEIRLYFAFVPQNIDYITNCDLDLYLVNDSQYHMYYNFIKLMDTLYFSAHSGVLEPNTKEFLESIRRDDINRLPPFVIQAIPFQNRYYEPQIPLHKEISISPVKFFKEKSFKENDFFEEKSILIKIEVTDSLEKEIDNLTPEQIDLIINKKEPGGQKSQSPKLRKRQDEQEEIVDLHIHEIIESERGLSNHEMLQIQMDHFHKAMEEAQQKRFKKIIFIHGIGNGTLKLELRKELDRNYKKFSYQDASFREYGYGATMVLLR